MPPTSILLIYTGGTIGMVHDPLTGTLMPLDFHHITQNVPELAKLNYQIEVHAFNPAIDSSDMNTMVWQTLAGLIEANYDKYDGFVILHGSDTMSYTASMLSFMLENLAKPVVLTGSQLPIGEIRTDAKENLITSIEIAATKNQGTAMVPEVCIYFDYRLFRGNRTKKYSSDSFEAFRSFNYPVLAEAGVHLRFNEQTILSANGKALNVYKDIDNHIGVLKIFPGISRSLVHCVLNAADLKAVILESFGAGNACTETWFLDELRDAIRRGLIIVDISQCDEGSVDLGRYETSRHLLDMGVLSGYDMTFEAALTKLMHLFGRELSREEVGRQMQQSLRGELSRNGI